MTILTPSQGEIIIAIVTICFGLFIEKWYVSRSSIMMNVVTWFILLFTIDTRPWILELLAVWLFIGFLLTYVSGYGGIKQFFGSKVFGSFALVLGLIKYGQLKIGGFWLLILAGIILAIVFALGRKLADNDDRNEHW